MRPMLVLLLVAVSTFAGKYFSILSPPVFYNIVRYRRLIVIHSELTIMSVRCEVHEDRMLS
jgi:ferric iron reductase protein FhuF